MLIDAVKTSGNRIVKSINIFTSTLAAFNQTRKINGRCNVLISVWQQILQLHIFCCIYFKEINTYVVDSMI